ncbi:hypothetical protein NT6N_23240 [Oceaniferula spumae]|uniref:CAAX prenyl protease 2/Lysostaphin resistance protein A-like domain-containing protein n=1 Tax=Oceaniferula spumae TaxID=2979115 RepID=A0AAT9FMQ5_9BACT
MFDLTQTVLIASFALCLLSMVGAIPLAAYMRRQSQGIGWNYRGMVRTEPLNQLDLLGIALLTGLYTLQCAFKLPQVIDFLVSTGLLSQTATETPDQIQLTPAVLTAGMISQAVPGMIVIVFLVFRQISVVEFFGLKWKHAPYLILLAPFAAVFVQMIFVGMEMAGYSTMIQEIFGKAEKQEIVKIYQETNAVSIRVLLAIAAVVIAPLVEETVFRGYIYPVCKRYTGRIIATFVTSLFFSAVHFNIPALLPLFILAILLTIAYELSGSLWVPISIHACFNGFTLLVQELQPPS